jgi:putative membrane protein insertion efficiency factor
MRQLLLLPIRFYQRFVSPLKPPCCRYHPTCSVYAQQAIEHHGLLRGSWLALTRILRCHPFAGYGEDPVPERKP